MFVAIGDDGDAEAWCLGPLPKRRRQPAVDRLVRMDSVVNRLSGARPGGWHTSEARRPRDDRLRLGGRDAGGVRQDGLLVGGLFLARQNRLVVD